MRLTPGAPRPTSIIGRPRPRRAFAAVVDYEPGALARIEKVDREWLSHDGGVAELGGRPLGELFS